MDNSTLLGLANLTTSVLPEPAKAAIANHVKIGVATAAELLAKPLNYLAKYKLDSEKNTMALKEEVIQKAADIPEGCQQEPDKRITIPALEANAYTDDETLRSMFANVIAKSMDKRYLGASHPAFVNIIRQLRPEEALLLKTTPILKDNSAVCAIRLQKKSIPPEYYSRSEYGDATILREYREGIDVYPYYLPQYNISPDEIGLYIDNIIRLNLIECPSGKHLTDINWYRMFYDDEFMQELRNKIAIRDGYELVQVPKVFAPTSFGKKFYEVCVE